MKKRVIALLLCLVFTLSMTPVSVFAEEVTGGEVTEGTTPDENETPEMPEETPEVPAEKTPLVTTKASGLDNWGAWNGTSAAKVEGAAEDGTSAAWVLTGGVSGGGAQFNLNVGFANANLTHKDDAGNVIAKTNGFIDASEFGIRYKSNAGFFISLKEEFRKSGSPTLQTKGVWVPSSNGEWATHTIKFSDFAHSDEIKDQWVHYIVGRYNGNFEPVVLMRIDQLNQGDGNSMTIDHLFANWYKEDMVSKVEWNEEPKKTYFQHHDDFDYTQGSIKVYRGGSETEYEVFTLDDPRVEITGYRNDKIYNDSNDSKNLEIKVSVLNNPLNYRVRVIPFAPETLTSIQVNNPKTEYFVGDPFDYETGLIQSNYSDKDPDFTKLDNINAKVEGFDSTTEGEKTITVTYGGQSTTYTINVGGFKEEGVTSIKVDAPRKVYTKGDKFFYYEGSVIPYKGDVAQTPLKMYNRYVTISGFDSTTVGEKEITVTYSGCTATYTIDVIESTPPVLRYTTMDMDNHKPSLWYNDKCKSELKAGAGEDGVSTGWYFTGSGTAQAALTGGWGTGDVQASDGSYVSGLIGADALAVRYKSDCAVNFRIILEYRASGKPAKNTRWAQIPASPEWTTAIIPMSAFEPDQTGESSDEKLESVEWVYNGIKGGYTTNFEPVVKFYVGVGNRTNEDGSAQSTTIDKVDALWYDTASVITGFTFTPEKTTYYTGEEFSTLGNAVVTYKDGTEKRGTASELGVTFTGFDNTVEGKQTVTAEYAGNKSTFEVEILAGGDEIVSTVLSDDAKTAYLIGAEAFDTSVGSIVVTYANGKVSNIPLSDSKVKVEGFDSSAQNTNLPVIITYEDLTVNAAIRVYKPVMLYSNAGFVDADGNNVSSFGSYDTVYATVKVTNRVPCDSPLTVNVIAVAYYNNITKLIKVADKITLKASAAENISIPLTAVELEGANIIKLMVIDDNLNNSLKTAPSIRR